MTGLYGAGQILRGGILDIVRSPFDIARLTTAAIAKVLSYPAWLVQSKGELETFSQKQWNEARLFGDTRAAIAAITDNTKRNVVGLGRDFAQAGADVFTRRWDDNINKAAWKAANAPFPTSKSAGKYMKNFVPPDLRQEKKVA